MFPSTGLQYRDGANRIEIRFALLVEYLSVLDSLQQQWIA